MSAATNFIATINGKLIDLGDIASQQTSHTVQISTNDPPMQRYSITFKQKVAIKTSNITGSMNGNMPNGAQRVTFGPRRSDVYVATSQVTTSGSGNTLSFSTDGITWYGLGATVLDINGQGICYNGRIWVATANTTSGTNTMAYSYDGRIWTGLGKSIFTNANSVIWNGTMFVAGGQGPSVGTGNTLAYSYDGINWIGLGASVCAYAVLNVGWNGRTWIACGQSTSTTGQTAFSLNGQTWGNSTTSSTVFTGNCVSVAWNGQTWLGVGGGGNTIGYSVDGTVWTPVISSTSYITTNGYAISWNGKVWVAGGVNSTNNLAYTTDPLGRTGWVALGRPIFSSGVEHIKWTGKTFIAFGTGGNTYGYSVDGINWTGGAGVVDTTKGGSCIEYNNRGIHSINFPQFTVYAGRYYSNNGTTWILATSLGNVDSPPKYNGKLWVGSLAGANYHTFSYDSINWYSVNLSGIQGQSRAFAWNGKLWVAVTGGQKTIIYSYDGFSWKVAATPFGTAPGGIYTGGYDVKWNGKLFIAVGSPSTMLYSYNGINWTSNNSILTTVCSAIGFNNTVWTIGTHYSYDGIKWFACIPNSNMAVGQPQSIDWNGQYFLLAGYNGYFISYDGILWLPRISTLDSALSTWTGSYWLITPKADLANGYISYNGISFTLVSLPAHSGSSNFGTTYNVPPIPYIQHPTIAVGAGQNTIAYSDDGITWQGLGSTIFSNEGYDAFWNGQMWVAAGNGGNSLAYSTDGLTWTGLGTSVFTTAGSAVAYNGQIWVATGSGTNTLAYSKNGINWTGLGTRVFSNQGYGICYNGTAWVAGGSFTGATGNTLAYSVDGITWTGIGSATFTTACYDVAMNGAYWFAVGQGGNTIAYTTTLNGSTGWTGLGTSIFSTSGIGICWNGQYFVAAGSGGNSLAYGNSISNPTFAGVTNSTNLLSAGTGICWNGVRFVATGAVGSGNTLAYSPDGITWYPGYAGTSTNLTSTIFTVNANCVASNPGVGFPTFDSQIILDPYGSSGTSTLDFYTEAYQQQGFSQISININVNNLL